MELSPGVARELEQNAIVYSFIGSNKTYLIVKVPGKKIVVRSIKLKASQLSDRIVEYRKQLNQTYSRDYLNSSKALYNLLIKPIESDLFRSNKITFVSDGILRSISMGSLNDGKQYLIEKYTINYSSGLSKKQGTIANRKFNALVAGASQFALSYPPLPSVKFEIEFLAAELRNPLILFDRNFTETKFSHALEDKEYSLIHLATHGFFGGNAKNSYLLTFDGRIDLDELNALFRRRAKPPYLLVLSACQTATGNSSAPLGISGIAMKSGVENVLATLWSIQDSAAESFVRDFYTQLSRGKTIPAARQAAAINRISSGDHVKVWSAFVTFSNFD